MRYMILIAANPDAFTGLGEAEMRDFGRRHLALSAALANSGELVISEGLADVSHARTVSVRDGRTLATDGPFAEAKEALAGFYVVDVDSLERAVEIAAQVPDAELAQVEVRPVLDMSQWDL